MNYPGLSDHPAHATARQILPPDRFGAMVSFELRGGAAAAERMFGRLTLPLHAPSLGGPETLVTRPAVTSHAGRVVGSSISPAPAFMSTLPNKGSGPCCPQVSRKSSET